jgi:hypothetical protein
MERQESVNSDAQGPL